MVDSIQRAILDIALFDGMITTPIKEGAELITPTVLKASLEHRIGKPVLHPIERLIEPILPNGKIPMHLLFIKALPPEIKMDYNYFESSRMVIEEGCVHLFGKVQFSYNIENGYFALFVGNIMVEVNNYRLLYDMLDEWHFNKRNLDISLYTIKQLKT